jgi:hypothetical protein
MTRNNYEVICKAIVEHGGGHKQWTLKLLWRGDRSPWWTASAGLDWPCDEAFFNAASIGDRISITAERQP